MKKVYIIFAIAFLSNILSAQYLIIGRDSISLNDFKKEYDYGLKNNGIDKTIASTEDFALLQQFAREQKADTTAYFKERLWDKEGELRKEFFFPKQVTEPLLQDFVRSNQTEKEVLVFIVQKISDDKTDYKKIYEDVISGKITMEDAISKYMKDASKSLYIKPGSLDNKMYNEIKVLPNNSYTKLYDTPSFIGFAKVLNSRPSLGYMIFGTLSYMNDSNSEDLKNKVYADLKAGKKFEEVVHTYATNEKEKNSGGVVMGSPTLPNEVYDQLKGQKEGFYSQPILLGDKYFIFYIYQIQPYELNDKNRSFFFGEMQNSLYSELLQDRMVDYVTSQKSYKEFPVYKNLKKSYSLLSAYSKDADVLYQYKNSIFTVGDIKKIIVDHKDEAAKLTDQQWAEAFENIKNQNILKAYSEDFPNLKEVKKELDTYKKFLYSDYIFSKYLTDEIKNHPEWLTQYYNNNKSKFIWGNRAKGRVAIIADEKLVKEIEKEIKNIAKWDALKAKYYGKLNAQNQVIVHFESGEMSEDADVFTKYKVPFKTGVHYTKMEKRDLVIAIDEILPPTQMTEDESKELLKDAVTDQKLSEIIAQQKGKTKIVIEPGFIEDLQKNFKK